MKRETIFLAALLHDIGKFWQRADSNGSTSSETLSSDTKKNIGLFCPQYDSKYSHKHVLWTAEFLDRNKASFQTALGKDNYESFFKASVKHHTPDKEDVYQLIVQKADHYASGVDRTGEAGKRDANAESNWDSFKDVTMVSIFEGLLRENEEYSYHIPVKALSLNDNIFPVAGKLNEKGQKSYAELWNSFECAFNAFKNTTGNALSFGENLSYLLYRYATTVPSSTMHLPDVSLYDHLKSTATFALCIHDYLQSMNRLDPSFKIEDNESPILLVGGDLSGIQKYIYDIVSTDAARNLKGRSFYLQIMVENAVELILETLQLPRSTILYSSGGGFYLLAPNTDEVKMKLTDVRVKLTNQIFEEHQTDLSLLIDWQEVTQAQIFNQGINEAWDQLAQKIARLKTQKFKEKVITEYAYFFQPSEVGGKQLRDYITGEEFNEAENQNILDGKPQKSVMLLEGDYPVRLTTYAQIELGKKLRQTDFWITSSNQISQWKRHEFQIGSFGIFNYLLSKEDLILENLQHPDNVTIRAFDIEESGFDNQRSYLKGSNCVYGFTFYGGSDYPEHSNGKPVTYDEMAKMGKGAKKLGILRMDVDNLGLIFSSGLDNRRRTFSRYSALSRQLDYFFKGYINKIWSDHFSENCSIIYSGGDDLFIVGQWDAIIDFASQIRKSFTNWTCHNPNLSISGGIALTNGKFPISKGAKFSEEAERMAKEHFANGNHKNAISLFGVPINWDLELPIVNQLKNEMVELIPKKLPRGLLQKLLNYTEKARMQENGGKSQSWRWHMAYDFSRAAKRQDEVAEPFYQRLKNAAFSDIWNGQRIPKAGNNPNSERTFLDLLEIATRWAEFETKE